MKHTLSSLPKWGWMIALISVLFSFPIPSLAQTPKIEMGETMSSKVSHPVPEIVYVNDNQIIAWKHLARKKEVRILSFSPDLNLDREIKIPVPKEVNGGGIMVCYWGGKLQLIYGCGNPKERNIGIWAQEIQLSSLEVSTPKRLSAVKKAFSIPPSWTEMMIHLSFDFAPDSSGLLVAYELNQSRDKGSYQLMVLDSDLQRNWVRKIDIEEEEEMRNTISFSLDQQGIVYATQHQFDKVEKRKGSKLLAYKITEDEITSFDTFLEGYNLKQFQFYTRGEDLILAGLMSRHKMIGPQELMLMQFDPIHFEEVGSQKYTMAKQYFDEQAEAHESLSMGLRGVVYHGDKSFSLIGESFNAYSTPGGHTHVVHGSIYLMRISPTLEIIEKGMVAKRQAKDGSISSNLNSFGLILLGEDHEFRFIFGGNQKNENVFAEDDIKRQDIMGYSNRHNITMMVETRHHEIETKQALTEPEKILFYPAAQTLYARTPDEVYLMYWNRFHVRLARISF